MTGVDLDGANLRGANLRGANLTRANLSGTTMKGTNVMGVVWSNTTCPDSTFSDSDRGTCTGHLGATVPTLGRAGAYPNSEGLGQVKPSTFSNGGDGTAAAFDITWTSWGGTQATGTGKALYTGSNLPTYEDPSETATVVAFDLGICDGTFMYQTVEWFFPQEGGSLGFPDGELNVCTGQ